MAVVGKSNTNLLVIRINAYVDVDHKQRCWIQVNCSFCSGTCNYEKEEIVNRFLV